MSLRSCVSPTAALSFVFVFIVGCGDDLGRFEVHEDARVPTVGLPALDAGSDAGAGHCDGARQQGCPTGQKCAVSEGTWQCITDGTQQPWQSCHRFEAGDTCIAGTHCYEGACFVLCREDTPCPGANVCVPISTSSPSELGICLQACDPVAQGCPSAGGARHGCFLFGTQTLCAPLTEEPQIPGASCQHVNDCVIGAGCLQVDGAPSCAAFCEPEGETCPENDECLPVLGTAGIGICHEEG